MKGSENQSHVLHFLHLKSSCWILNSLNAADNCMDGHFNFSFSNQISKNILLSA